MKQLSSWNTKQKLLNTGVRGVENHKTTKIIYMQKLGSHWFGQHPEQLARYFRSWALNQIHVEKKAQILQHGRLVIIFHTCNTHLNHGFNHASCVKQPVCLHGIRCGTSCGQSSSASCGQCRLYCAYGPWHSIRIHAYEVQGIHKQHRSSFGCGSWLCRSGGKECESCCAFYQTNLFP